MDITAALKSVEAITSSLKDLAPHLKGFNLGSTLGLARAGGAVGPVIVVGVAALAIGAGVGILLAPERGAQLRAQLGGQAKKLSARLKVITARSADSKLDISGSEDAAASTPAPMVSATG
jgi:gas vesicle protein